MSHVLITDVVQRGQCYGCGACMNICPNKAIGIRPDGFGFLSPVLDADRCTGCGLCERACPRLHPEYRNDTPKTCMAVMADDKARLHSSSGGLFTLLAGYVFDRVGLVFGAELSQDLLVRHVCVNSVDGLRRIRGSKYAQSNTGLTYQDAKKALDAGRLVLYCGCPCQIAGLKAFLCRNYENLITVDLICCGNPSAYSMREYIDGVWGVDNVATVRFRNMAGWDYRFEAFFRSGESETDPYGAYMNMYLKHALNKSACDTCQFNVLPRQGDFTIGDFWNVKSLDASMDDRKGTSILLCNNAKARRIWGVVKRNGIAGSREFTVDQAYDSGVTFLKHGPAPYPRRDQFYAAVRSEGFTRATRREAHHFDVGIAGTWLANYGTISTNWALYNIIRSFGLSACILNVTGNGQLDGKADIPSMFIRSKNIPQACYFVARHNYRELNKYCDMFVTASDQLWGYFSPYAEHAEYVHLGFADDGKKLVAAGTAIGSRDVQFKGADIEKRRKWLSRFSYIGVREDFGPDVLKDTYGVESEHIQDPVFLCDKKLFLQEAANSTFKPAGRFVFAYFVYKNSSSPEFELAKKVAQAMGIGLITSLGCGSDIVEYGPGMSVIKRHGTYYRNWMRCMRDADFVLTNSFHGACMSLILERDFAVVKGQGWERIGVLGRDFHCSERMFQSLEDFDIDRVAGSHVDYKAITPLVDAERSRCVAALRKAFLG